MDINPIIKVMAEQIGANELKMAHFKLAIYTPTDSLSVIKGKKRLEITYSPGRDDYTITKQKFKRFFGDSQDLKEEVLEGIYCDQLQELIEEFFKFHYIKKFTYRIT